MANYKEYNEHMTLPLLPLMGTVFVFPKTTTTYNVSDSNSINVIEDYRYTPTTGTTETGIEYILTRILK